MKSFLLVDDDNKMLTMSELFIRHRFGDSSILISKASNGLEALERTRELDYTVILTDIEMPRMNGIEFHKRLKEEKPVLAERTAFISGNLEGADNTYLREERRPCLAKPFSSKNFFELIDTVLSVEKHRFTTRHGYHCKRKSARYNTSAACILELLTTVPGEGKAILGEITDYSEDGIGITFRETCPTPGEALRVSSEPLGLTEREGLVVWAGEQNGAPKIGLRWARGRSDINREGRLEGGPSIGNGSKGYVPPEIAGA